LLRCAKLMYRSLMPHTLFSVTWGCIPGKGRYFLLPNASRQALRYTHWVPWAFSPEVKRLEREVDHSTLSNIGAKNVWDFPSTLSYVLMMCCLRTVMTLLKFSLFNVCRVF